MKLMVLIQIDCISSLRETVGNEAIQKTEQIRIFKLDCFTKARNDSP